MCSATANATGLVQLIDHQPAPVDLRGELLSGLSRRPRRIAAKFFYDQRGSELFDRITAQPEYYLARTEQEILQDAMDDIVRCIGPDAVLIEPGSGSCEKVEPLLAALAPRAYVPLDISAHHLAAAAYRLAERWPTLPILAITADYHDSLELPPTLPPGRRVVFFPGSTLGNFEPMEAQRFLSLLRRLIGPDGGVLIGIDQDKDPALLYKAYNDAAGLTAAFNKNILLHVNRILGANFQPQQFEHRAFYNRTRNCVEMHLYSRCRQAVRIGHTTLTFAAGDSIHTENSYKYSPQQFLQLATVAGLMPRHCWTDRRGWFAVHYLEAAPSTGESTTSGSPHPTYPAHH